MNTRITCASLALLAACATADAPESTVTIETLPNGATLRTYADRPEVERWSLSEAVRLGTVDGSIETAFGDVRGLERDTDGSIIVLDYQANDIRRFTAGGEYIETIARGGDGPGEIGNSNGLFLDDDGTLWINDHDHWTVTGLRRDGSVESVGMPSRSYGYLWEGTVTRDGWIWDTRVHSAAPAAGPGGELEPGLISNELLVFLKGNGIDESRTGGQVDSVLIGGYASRSVFLERGYASVPHSPRFLTAIDPAGAVWTAWGGEYRLTKKDIRGDTLVIVQMPDASHPVTEAQRELAIERLEAFMEDVGRVVPLDYDEILPTHHPVIDQIIVDDAGRLWVGRQGPDGGSEYDVFSPQGEVLAFVRSEVPFQRYFRPVIRGSDFLTMVQDELEVHYVVRAEIARDPG